MDEKKGFCYGCRFAGMIDNYRRVVNGEPMTGVAYTCAHPELVRYVKDNFYGRGMVDSDTVLLGVVVWVCKGDMRTERGSDPKPVKLNDVKKSGGNRGRKTKRPEPKEQKKIM